MKFKKGDLVRSIEHPHDPLPNRYRIIGIEGDMPNTPWGQNEKMKLSSGMIYLLSLELEQEPPDKLKKDIYEFVQANDGMLDVIK